MRLDNGYRLRSIPGTLIGLRLKTCSCLWDGLLLPWLLRGLGLLCRLLDLCGAAWGYLWSCVSLCRIIREGEGRLTTLKGRCCVACRECTFA